MLNCVPCKDIPQEAAHKALREYKIPVHAGFLMGEPQSSDKDGGLYFAFGMYDVGSGTRKEPHYFYLGLSHSEQIIKDGFYYSFDCFNAFLSDRLFVASAFDSDKDAINTAANYEADLYKHEYKNGERIVTEHLYCPYGDTENE